MGIIRSFIHEILGDVVEDFELRNWEVITVFLWLALSVFMFLLITTARFEWFETLGVDSLLYFCMMAWLVVVTILVLDILVRAGSSRLHPPPPGK